ncbi:putative peptidyl-prolyl cis-trans isomerase [Abditibacteriota bacterium]|nr:putative peptidyl-prolyl cis-trans isomerase [Abditibacteriota bacterium]
MVFRPLSSGAAFFVLTAGAALWVSGCTSQAQENATPPDTKQVAKTYQQKETSLGPAASTGEATSYTAAMKKVAVAPPPADFKVAEHPRVEFDTARGKIVFELDSTKAPMNVKSFVYLASKGFYKNTRFHRQDDLSGDGKGMIIQGGDPLSADPRTYGFSGSGGPGYTVPLEISDLKHDQYVLAAARSNDPDSAGSQFYITQGETHFLDGQYTVFGKIVEGKDVAAKLEKGDKLLAVKVLEASKPKNAPKTP